MLPGTYDPGLYVPQYIPDFLVPQYPPPPHHILSPSVCTLFRIFTSVVLHFRIDPYIPRSLYCFPPFMFPRRAYLCFISQCFVFLLFCTFIDLYIRCFVLSLFRSISISLFHTPVVSHFMVSSALTTFWKIVSAIFVQTLNCYDSVNIAARLTKMLPTHSAAHGASIRVNGAKEDKLLRKHICGLAHFLYKYRGRVGQDAHAG